MSIGYKLSPVDPIRFSDKIKIKTAKKEAPDRHPRSQNLYTMDKES